MVEDVRISCIIKSDRTDPHERIQSVGGIHNDKAWKLSLDDAIRGIKDNKWRFWTSGGGMSVWVIIATHNGHEYLKTENDGIMPDNLLALPNCPQ
jgi:hypothetical protein